MRSGRQPLFKIFSALAFIASAAKQLQIGWIVRPAANDRYDMIDLKLLLVGFAHGATAVLSRAKSINVFDSVGAAVLGLSRSSVLSVHSHVRAPIFKIGRTPRLISRPHFLRVFAGVSHHFRAVATRVFGTAFSGPLGLKTGPHLLPFAGSVVRAGNALASRNASAHNVPVLARLAGEVMSFSRRNGGEAFWNSFHVNYSNAGQSALQGA